MNIPGCGVPPEFRSHPSFISGKRVSVGKSKLCQRKFCSSLASRTTRFPLFRSFATGLIGLAAAVRLVDHKRDPAEVDPSPSS
ncbi:hypothetical protein CDL15_Pgr016977 [Punica granatum]|uniref:Uncharacterized protein n=1 Tax=Punica granatum TaxID=22663 RepID=A0A218WYJ3_PUNGR|nr:hypothetical protein CDL15_Pgr016977 [Punica granatum]